MIVLDQIKNRTGISVEAISNSEQRFLDYKAVATRGKEFDDCIEGGTAILDIGGLIIVHPVGFHNPVKFPQNL